MCVQVEFSVEKSTFHLLVDGFRVTDGRLTNDEGSSLALQNPVYLGGDLHSKTTKVCITPQSLTLYLTIQSAAVSCMFPVLIHIQYDPPPPTGTQYSYEQCYRLCAEFQNE